MRTETVTTWGVDRMAARHGELVLDNLRRSALLVARSSDWNLDDPGDRARLQSFVRTYVAGFTLTRLRAVAAALGMRDDTRLVPPDRLRDAQRAMAQAIADGVVAELRAASLTPMERGSRA